MKKINKKGFTLIELLVVIAIIGLLSTMAVISLNSARAKARDARRLSDVKQLSTMLSLAAADNPNTPLTCGGSPCQYQDLTNELGGPADLVGEFSKFTDPNFPTPAATDACTFGDTDACAYAFGQAGLFTVGSTTIGFVLENDSGGLTAGYNTINSEGIFNP